MTWRGWGVSHLSWAIRWMVLVIASCLGWTPASTQTRPVVSLSSQVDALALTDRLEFLVDGAGDWQPNMPPPGAGFTPLNGRWNRDNFGTREAHVWFRTTLDTGDTGGGDWLWVVANPHLDFVDLWIHTTGQAIRTLRAGDMLPVAQRLWMHRFPVLPLVLEPGLRTSVFMQVRTSGTAQVPVALWQPAALWADDQTTYSVLGLYFGLLIGLFFYNLLLCLTLRERVYQHYITVVASIGIFQFCSTGLAVQYFWPDGAKWNPMVQSFSLVLAGLFSLLFARAFLAPAQPGQPVRAIPGAGLDSIPIWLLGSSDFSARLAAELGLPFSFAGHFSPEGMAAMRLYRHLFKPSEILDRPYAMIGVPVIAADTDEAARYLSTTQQLKFLSLVRGNRLALQPPVDSMDGLWNEWERQAVHQKLAASIVGGPDTVRQKLEALVAQTEADEVMIVSDFHRLEDRLRSYEIVASLKGERASTQDPASCLPA